MRLSEYVETVLSVIGMIFIGVLWLCWFALIVVLRFSVLILIAMGIGIGIGILFGFAPSELLQNFYNNITSIF